MAQLKGLTRLGIQSIPPICRGRVALNMAPHKGAPYLRSLDMRRLIENPALQNTAKQQLKIYPCPQAINKNAGSRK